MSYLLKGSLSGYICRSKKEALSGLRIKLYWPEPESNITASAIANPKQTIRLLSPNAAEEKQSRLLAEGEIDEKGNYSFEITHKEYKGGPVEIDIIGDRVPGQKQIPKEPCTHQLTITTLQPSWRERKDCLIAYWQYCIPHKYWCAFRELFDAWVICGRVTFCNSKKPVPGITVTALDADWITDDNLGSDITDANGYFRIDYSSIDFKQTFLSPLINVETPFPPFGTGPDIYFSFAFGSGPTLYNEGRARGQQPDRENVGVCFCPDVCIPEDVDIPDDTEQIPASFKKIGYVGDYSIVDDIDATTGKTIAAKGELAFFSNIALRGALTKKLDGVAMEYLFEFQEYNTPTGLPIGAWQEVNPSQISRTVIGTLWEFVSNPADPHFPVKETNYTINGNPAQEHLANFNGNWIQVPQEPNFAGNVNGALLTLKTPTLASATVDMSSLVQGLSSTTVAPLQQNRYFKIRMTKRQVGNPASAVAAGMSKPIAIFNTTYQNVPQKGSWAPTTQNEHGVACIDIQQLASAGGCSNISNQIDVNYTAASPNLGNVSLSMTGPGGPYGFPALGSGVDVFGSASPSTSIAALPNCAYLVTLSAEMKLTNGEYQHNNIWDQVAFCK